MTNVYEDYFHNAIKSSSKRGFGPYQMIAFTILAASEMGYWLALSGLPFYELMPKFECLDEDA